MDSATHTHLESLRESLASRLRDLRSELDAAAQARQAGPADAVHEVSDRKDQAGQRESAGIADETEHRALEEAELVEAALKRLDEGKYGDCQDCGEPIAWQRLQVQPAAPRCASCQALRERALEQAAPHHRH